MNIKQHNPMHPGTFIKQVYLEPNNIKSNELARKLKVSHGLMSRIITKKTGISSEMAIKLSIVLGRSAESWLIMQDNYDLHNSKQNVDCDQYEKLELVSSL